MNNSLIRVKIAGGFYGFLNTQHHWGHGADSHFRKLESGTLFMLDSNFIPGKDSEPVPLICFYEVVRYEPPVDEESIGTLYLR